MLTVRLPEFEDQESCNICEESFPPDYIIHCDCGEKFCTFCYDEHEKICEEHVGGE